MSTEPLTKKQALTKGWSDFFESLKTEHQLFALTIVFRPVDQNNSQERWEGEYTAGVLKKFRQALERHPSNQESALPFPDFYYFERNEASVHRVSGSRKPFHIHALLPIRKNQLGRIWSMDNNDLKERLKQDVYSLGTIQSILVEPVRDGHTLDWVRYVAKFKQI